jgi:hypothetical protein
MRQGRDAEAMSYRRRRIVVSRSQPKCKHCQALFTPDCRNRRHQRYCGDADCRRASKAASQKRWVAKPENHDYFRGAENVARVQRWRAANPGYAKRGPRRLPKEVSPLQEVLDTQVVDKHKESPTLALQELSPTYPLVLLGLIAHLTGTVQQETMPHAALSLLYRSGNYAGRAFGSRDSRVLSHR